MKKINVGIIGHAGRLGKPLKEILGNHTFAEVVYTESRGEGKQGNLSEAEIAFLALPYGESEKYLPLFHQQKIIDLSIDHRCNGDWVYGLPEVFGSQIKNATRVANPGCYATTILLGLFPLRGKIKQVNISSTSGISGAGKMAAKEDNFLVYQEGKHHPQIQEIEKILGIDNLALVPQRIDTADRGIVSTIFLCANTAERLSELYADFYESCPFVRIKEAIETKNVIGTNYCDIKILEFNGNVVIISALDNLIKGGAGQAVQNFNLMFGFPETTGLI